MKLLTLLAVFLFLTFVKAKAQDTLTIRDRGTMLVTVVESNDSFVKYTLLETEDTSVYSISKLEVVSIRYFDRAKKRSAVSDSSVIAVEMPINWELRGRIDARTYYNGKHCGVGWITFATILIPPFMIWIPYEIASKYPPKEKNLNIPDSILYQMPDYSNAYRNEAFRIKKAKMKNTYNKVAKVYAMALGGLIILAWEMVVYYPELLNP